MTVLRQSDTMSVERLCGTLASYTSHVLAGELVGVLTADQARLIACRLQKVLRDELTEALAIDE